MTEFNKKAELYHKYRWDYSPEAINYITQKGQINRNSAIADIGAGTGILTKHFIDKTDNIFAVEPDRNMLSILETNLPGVKSIERFAHDLPEIDKNSVDILLASHAIHWFNFEKTIMEFNRIGKENCLLFTLCNKNITKGDYTPKTENLINKYKNQQIQDKHDNDNKLSYFRKDTISECYFDFNSEITLEQYTGSLSSIAFMPSPEDSIYERFTYDAGKTFNKLSKNGKIKTQIRTNVVSGKLKIVNAI
ncbi:MAG: class I SAM-dependent methyltransferase [Deltaproteobacteria bacterium]|nr:class I SAM-dependent methyltransferase [Deltaproteobacteria bacterium]